MPVIELDMPIAFVNALDKLHKTADNLFQKILKGEIKNVKLAISIYGV
ncbi:MAG: hypothetical protein ACUVTD_07105 [Nitrososphaerales archaeon]